GGAARPARRAAPAAGGGRPREQEVERGMNGAERAEGVEQLEDPLAGRNATREADVGRGGRQRQRPPQPPDLGLAPAAWNLERNRDRMNLLWRHAASGEERGDVLGGGDPGGATT